MSGDGVAAVAPGVTSVESIIRRCLGEFRGTGRRVAFIADDATRPGEPQCCRYHVGTG